MSLSKEDLDEILREILEFKAAQRERKPKTVAEELGLANELLQRLLVRHGGEVCSVINAGLDPDYRGREPRRSFGAGHPSLNVALAAANEIVKQAIGNFGEEAAQRIFLPTDQQAAP